MRCRPAQSSSGRRWRADASPVTAPQSRPEPANTLVTRSRGVGSPHSWPYEAKALSANRPTVGDERSARAMALFMPANGFWTCSLAASRWASIQWDRVIGTSSCRAAQRWRPGAPGRWRCRRREWAGPATHMCMRPATHHSPHASAASGQIAVLVAVLDGHRAGRWHRSGVDLVAGVGGDWRMRLRPTWSCSACRWRSSGAWPCGRRPGPTPARARAPAEGEVAEGDGVAEEAVEVPVDAEPAGRSRAASGSVAAAHWRAARRLG